LLAVGYGTVSYFEYIFFYWIYYYFREIRRMSQSETSTYTTVIFLAWVVMTPLGGWLSDRLIRIFGKKTGRPMVPVVCILLSALLLFLGTHVSGSFVVGALLALSFGLASASDGPFWVATIDAGGEDVGAACGVLNTGSNIGGFVAPVLTPFIASLLGWSSALYFGCFVATVGAAIWFLMDATPSSADFARLEQTSLL
jgi:MFS family permease